MSHTTLSLFVKQDLYGFILPLRAESSFGCCWDRTKVTHATSSRSISYAMASRARAPSYASRMWSLLYNRHFTIRVMQQSQFNYSCHCWWCSIVVIVEQNPYTSTNINFFLPAVRFEPRTSGWEARRLPLCYAAKTYQQQESHEFLIDTSNERMSIIGNDSCSKLLVSPPSPLLSLRTKLSHFPISWGQLIKHPWMLSLVISLRSDASHAKPFHYLKRFCEVHLHSIHFEGNLLPILSVGHFV